MMLVVKFNTYFVYVAPTVSTAKSQGTTALPIELSPIGMTGCVLVWRVGTPGSMPASTHHYIYKSQSFNICVLYIG